MEAGQSCLENETSNHNIMKKLIILALLVFALPALAQKQSEATTTGTVTNIVRLTSVVPIFSDDSSVTLLSITEQFKQFSLMPNGQVVQTTTFARQWTSASIAALPDVWTNNAGVVITNNAVKVQLQGLWNRLDSQPERSTFSITQPNSIKTQTPVVLPE